MTEPHERLRLARKRRGYETADDAAKAFGWRGSTYSGHENGSRGIRPEVAERYARAFRVSPEWILYGVGASGIEQSAIAKQGIPVVGTIGHDKIFSISPMQQKQLIDIGLYAEESDQWEAILVTENAGEEVYREGMALLYRPVLYSDSTEIIGQECVIELADGRRLIRRPYPSQDKVGYWDLEGHFDRIMTNQLIRWATPIRLVHIFHVRSPIAA